MNIRHAFIAEGSALFQVLHQIANATNIILAVWLLGVLLLGLRQKTLGGYAWLASISCIAVVYLIKTVEGKLDLWQSINADYSTHSALAAALVVSLCFLVASRRIVALAAFVAYEVLIFLLGFHSILDIVTTLIVVIPLMILVWKLFSRTKADTDISVAST